MEANILIIVPAYRAARYLPELVRRITAIFPSGNLLIINDGSPDETDEILRDYNCHKISFEQNRGKGEALKVGFDYALDHGFEAVITIDADLQHPPEDLRTFRDRYDKGDILIGTRAMETRLMPWDRLVTNNLTSIIISIMGTIRMRDSQSGYRLIKAPVLRKMQLRSSRYDTESEMLFQAGYLGFTTAEVPIETVYEGSHSFINPLVDTGRFIRQIWKRLWY